MRDDGSHYLHGAAAVQLGPPPARRSGGEAPPAARTAAATLAGPRRRPRLPATYVADAPTKATFTALTAVWSVVGVYVGFLVAGRFAESPLWAMWLALMWLGGAAYLLWHLDGLLGRIRITARGVRRIGLWLHEDVPWERVGTVSVCAHDPAAALLGDYAALKAPGSGVRPHAGRAGGAAARVATLLARGAPASIPTLELRSRDGHLVLEVAKATFGWDALRALCAEAEARGIPVVVY